MILAIKFVQAMEQGNDEQLANVECSAWLVVFHVGSSTVEAAMAQARAEVTQMSLEQLLKATGILEVSTKVTQKD